MTDTLLEKVDALLGTRSDRTLERLLQESDTAALAELLEELSSGKRKVFAHLPPERQAEVTMLLSEGTREIILPRLADAVIARFLHFCDEDNATDVLQVLPEERRIHILGHLRGEKRARIEKLLTFGSETAGGIMDLNFLEVPVSSTVSTVIEAVHEYAKKHKQVPVVLLSDAKGLRWAPARSLVSAAKSAGVEQLSKPVPAILHSVDREDVLDLMGKENSDIACVVDNHRKILGVIHLNDLLRIAEAEASEDAYRMGAVGLIDMSYLDSGFGMIWRKRVGWLSVLFVAELFTFTALARFESSIAAVTALALFVPLCISTGGNSGSQAATLITRAMALGHVTTADWWRVLRRELVMGVALGLALGSVGFIRAALTPQHVLGTTDRWTIGIVISLSVAAICLWGTLVGSMLPILFKKFGFDPAYASSPFVATFVDVTGIVIYFSIANGFILG